MRDVRLLVLGVLVFVTTVAWTTASLAQVFCFDPAVDYPVGTDERSVTAADLDGDLDIDLVLPDWANNRVYVLINNGSGVFAPAVGYGTGLKPIAVSAGDLDGDTDLDLVVADYGANQVSVLINLGSGTFAPAVSYPTGDGPFSVVTADLDGDTDLDVATANIPGGFVAGNISVMMNNGNGTFGPGVSYLAGDAPSSIIANDVDKDGDLDLAVVDGLNARAFVLKNNGSGSFGAPVGYPVGVNPAWLTAVDVDGDADDDFVVADNTSPNVAILKNNGDGTYAAAVNYPVSTRPWSVVAADFDGDSDYDLAAAIPEGNKVSLLENHGDGTFAAAVDYATGSTSLVVVASDFDGNTTRDLAVSKGLGGAVSVLLNCRTPCITPPADMVLWLPFDEMTPGPSKNMVAPFDGLQFGSLLDLTGMVADALRFDGVSSYVDVPSYPEIFADPNPGTGDFTVDAWVMRTLGDNGVRVIAEKRSNPAPDTYVGFSFYMYDGRLGIQLANGTYSGWNTLPGEIVPQSGWHHVAVTVDRDNPAGGQFYLDGQPLGTPFDPTVRSGSLSSNSRFRVGAMSFSVSSVFRGGIDEVEMFSRCLNYLEIQSIYNAQGYGKCSCYCPWQADFNADTFLDSVDLNALISALFFNGPDPKDPYCPKTRGDFNGDGASDSTDLNKLIQALFFNGPGPVDPCAP